MNYEDVVEIERLAGLAFNTRLVIEAHQMANTPTDPEERRQAFIEMELAKAANLKAEGELRCAQGQMLAFGHLRRGSQ